MKLNYIELTNFRSHKKSFLDLNTFESAVVVGKNGAGKSSFAYGFCFCFWGDVEGLKNADLIRTNATEMEVTVGFTHDDGNEYRVVRGIKVTGVKKKSYSGYLSLERKSENGAIVDSLGNRYSDDSGNSIPATTKKISSLLGDLTLKTAIYSNFDLQGETSRFMEAMASDRRKLFEDILNLQPYEILEKKARAQVKKARTILQGLDIDDVKEAELELKITTAETNSGELKKQAEDFQDIVDELAKRKHELDAIVAEGTLELEKKKQPILNDIMKIDDSVADVSRRLVDFAALLGDKENILAKYDALQDKIVELKNAQEARQAYTVAKGERKVAAGQFSFCETKIAQITQDITKKKDALYSQTQKLLEKYQLTEKDSIVAHLAALKNDTKQSIQSNSDAALDAKNKLAAITEEQLDLTGKISSLETTERSQKEQIKKIKEAGALCPIFNKACDKLTKEHRDKELAGIESALSEAIANKTLLVEQKKANEQKRDEYRKQIEAFASEEKKATQTVSVVENDSENYSALQSKTETEIAEASQKLEIEKKNKDKLEAELDKLDLVIIATGFNPDQYIILESSLKTLEAGDWQKRKEQLMVAEASHVDLEKQKTELIERKEVLKAQMLDIGAAIEAQQKKISSAKEDLSTVNLTINTNKSKLAAANVELSELSRSLGVLQTLLNQMREQKNKSIEYQRQMQEYSILEKTYKKARALIVENSVPKFQELCNEILDYLDVNVRIRVETLEESKDSKTKEIKFTPTFKIIVVDGNQGIERDYNTWSGGEKQRINLALRQALSTILLNRAGTRMDLIIIDESDSALDTEGKEALVKLIQANVEGRFGRSTKVMCITHTDDLKDSFPVRILVKMHKGASQISEIQ